MMSIFKKKSSLTIYTGLMLAALALAVAVAPARPVQAASNKKKVEKTVRRFFNGARAYKIKKMKKCFAKEPEGVFFTDNKYMRKYCKKRNKTIRYEIRRIKVKHHHAIAVVHVSYPDAYKSIRKACKTAFQYQHRHPSASNKKIQQILYKKIKKYDKKKFPKTNIEKTITIKLIKKKKSWKIKKMTENLMNIPHCRFYDAAYDYFNE